MGIDNLILLDFNRSSYLKIYFKLNCCLILSVRMCKIKLRSKMNKYNANSFYYHDYSY